ncbi:type II toxin-antitoxin system PemK/MazF family toxin [Dyadobacter alkalitolerans]|uniref:type II toxin-antitoxin system PemK/MazF family toxin n=1 Tax=Dyadobacter alkalitolerans TaxID=492736 RepID=UPI00286D76CA|nr:type II toxin-antitoxin system PemK/MazF family toxin [Dyadobacter alkalitolerans]
MKFTQVIPITTRNPGGKIYPNEVLISANNFGLGNESVILCHQIRTLDKQRLSLLYGTATSLDTQVDVVDALCFQLGIERE